MTSYEAILEAVASLTPSARPDERKVEWLSAAGSVGLSRTQEGRVEIFLAGDELKPLSRTVRESIEYQTWHRGGRAPSIDANRLILPAAGHFDQIAAFLCTEMLRNGADNDLATAFRRSESVIEMAIARLLLSDQALLGLTGELLLLEALLRRAQDDQVGSLASSWFGWRESTRDISWNSIGIEVKTTTRTGSSHRVQGVHQVEAQDHSDDDGEVERCLFLVSIGLEWAASDRTDTYTLPGVTDSILARFRESLSAYGCEEATEAFLAHVNEYGARQEIGYDHRTMSDSAVFKRPFVVRFVRSYDMTDPAVEVLRSGDVTKRFHVDLGSVNFRVNLPNQVQGDVNPVVGLTATAEMILRAGLQS